MEFKEGKGIVLSDGNKYLVLKNLQADGNFVVTLKVTNGGEFVILQRIGEMVKIVDDNATIDRVLDALFADQEFEANFKENYKRLLEIYKNRKN